MKISEVAAFIHTPIIEWARPQSWCDLGCGTETFTMALARSLAPGSTIHAVDLDRGALGGIPDEYHGVTIRKVLGDLRSSELRLPSVNGILMANSLHFIQDQQLLLRKLLPVTDYFLIVERSRSSPWGPYPVGFEKLCQLFSEAGMEHIEKLAARRSRFGDTMYSAFARTGAISVGQIRWSIRPLDGISAPPQHPCNNFCDGIPCVVSGWRICSTQTSAVNVQRSSKAPRTSLAWLRSWSLQITRGWLRLQKIPARPNESFLHSTIALAHWL
jgi:hypothetical protein